MDMLESMNMVAEVAAGVFGVWWWWKLWWPKEYDDDCHIETGCGDDG